MLASSPYYILGSEEKDDKRAFEGLEGDFNRVMGHPLYSFEDFGDLINILFDM